MEWWQAVILGLVEGITEYLPISSTGHLILTSAALGLDAPAIKDSVDAFNIVIQGGAILAVLGLYAQRVSQMIHGLLGKDEQGFKLLVNIGVAFVPAAALGVVLEETIDRWLFGPGPVVVALFLGGVFMIWLDLLRSGRLGRVRSTLGSMDIHEISAARALVIGLLQCVAMWPGTSRSMMTISGGVLVGLSPRRSAEFSFLLGLPTLGGACAFKLAKNLAGDGPNLFEVIGVAPAVIGLVVATLSAALAVRWLVGFLNRHGLSPFGYYRFALCAVVLVAIGMGWVRIGGA